MKNIFYTLLLLFLTVLPVKAQEWLNVHQHKDSYQWTIPLRIDGLGEMTVDEVGLYLPLLDAEGEEAQRMMLGLSGVDSLTFVSDLQDEEKGHDKYEVFTLHIHTLDAQPVKDKETWVDCHFSLDGKGQYSHYSGTGKIRGRGNSTWEWYDKKPYKIKLDEKSKLVGLEKAKNWNLLANYRDVTDLMNAVAFEAARCLGMPYTNHTRFVEIFLNGDYIGLYQLTEKIEVGNNRVDIDKEGGLLISFDLDDGPSLSPGTADNFTSSVYGLPVCVKYPEEPTKEFLDGVKKELAVIEKAIKQHDYAMVDSLVDIPSMIGVLQLHEFLYNVEIDAPRSLYAFRDKGGKLTFGPVWDWDAGYDFDWGNMLKGHDFFADYHELIYGTAPATQEGAAYHVKGFWTDMFHDATFVEQYKQRWNGVCDTLLPHVWDEMEKYIAHLREGAYQRDLKRWPLGGKSIDVELDKMHKWLTDRMNYVTRVINNYPPGTSTEPSEGWYEDDYQIQDGAIVINKTLSFKNGYSQRGVINIPRDVVRDLMGVTPNSLVPLNADGSEGQNTAAKSYGAWFDEYGNTRSWGWGHVYLESDDLYTWSYGCHPENCRPGHTHTVRMQYARSRKHLTVIVNFKIE